jgi:ABC-type glycerol-3-phosphate transport system substrate-binding protein
MSVAPISRRVLLKAAGPVLLRAGGLAAAASPAACAGDPRRIEVFVIWSGDELSTFRRVLEPFQQDSGLHVNVVGLGEQMDELIRARFDAGNPPDVVITPRPGTMMPYAGGAGGGRLASLDQVLDRTVRDSVAGDLLPGLQEVVTKRDVVTGRDKVYGLWVRASHKSCFWYRPSTFAAADKPQTWDELVRLARRLAGLKRLTPLSIGAADGWVLTDWFENALVGTAGTGSEVYDKLADGVNHGVNLWHSEVVGKALTKLAELWSIPGVFPFSPARALLTQYDESVVQVFGSRRAGMVFAGNFVEGLISSYQKEDDADHYRVFPFPPSRGSQHPLVIGGDVAMLPTRPNGAPSPGGRKLVEWLAHPEVFTKWIDQGGFLSPYKSMLNLIVSRRMKSPVAAGLAGELHDARKVYFDLSDRLSGRLAGGQGRGMGRMLQDFFAAVSAPGANLSSAVRHAQDRLAEAASQR